MRAVCRMTEGPPYGVRIKQVHRLLSNKRNKGIDIDAAPRP